MNSLLFIAPFLAFFFGYILVPVFLTEQKTIFMPNLVGKMATEGLLTLSELQLNVRILKIKEDSCFREGTIIEQIPNPQSKIKQNQQVYLVVTKEPTPFQPIDLFGKTEAEIRSLFVGTEIVVKIIFISHPIHKPGLCFAYHYFLPKHTHESYLIAYLSCGDNEFVIWPSFTGKKLDDIAQFFLLHQITPVIKYKENEKLDNSYTIIDQRPTAGSIIEKRLINSIPVHLLVSQ